MVNVKSILKIVLIILIIMFLFISTIFIYFQIVFNKSYSKIIEDNLTKITLNNANLTKNLVLSIIKQESKFNKKAKSNRDAFGLMQLTYPTAKEVADKLNIEINIDDLYNPEINIKLGVNYLNYLFTIFDDKQLVIISYNAGFNKVKSWQENNELILENGVYITPYKETTNYLKKVLQNEKIYNLRKNYGKTNNKCKNF